MPWTIWPALVVLWGVCWMFRPRTTYIAATEAAELVLPLSPERAQQPPSSQGISWPGDTGVDTPTIDAWLNNLDSTGITMFADQYFGDISHIAQYEPAASGYGDFTLPVSITIAEPVVRMEETTTNSIDSLNPTLTQISASDQESQPYARTTAPAIQNAVSTTKTLRSEPGPLECAHCPRKFSRQDALKRHQDALEAVAADKFLCPLQGCKRSKKGSGFGRLDNLRNHLKTHKRRPTLASGVQIIPQPPILQQPAAEPDAVAGSFTSQENSPVSDLANQTEPVRSSLRKEQIYLDLQKLYHAEKENLRVKEENHRRLGQECKQSREKLASLKTVMKMCEKGKEAASDLTLT